MSGYDTDTGGDYTVTLTVTDDDGATWTEPVMVESLEARLEAISYEQRQGNPNLTGVAEDAIVYIEELESKNQELSRALRWALLFVPNHKDENVDHGTCDVCSAWKLIDGYKQ